MKILQINNYHSLRGGSDRIYLETGALLEQCGHEVMWFAGRHPENLPIAGAADFPSVAGLARANPVELPKFIFNREAAKALDAKIRREGRPDIAHLHIYHGGLTTAILARLATPSHSGCSNRA